MESMVKSASDGACPPTNPSPQGQKSAPGVVCGLIWLTHFRKAVVKQRAGGSKGVENTLARRRQHLKPAGKEGQAANLAALALCEANEHELPYMGQFGVGVVN